MYNLDNYLDDDALYFEPVKKEEATYTLIPNGTRKTFKQGFQGLFIRAFLVQHDQSGLTLQWEGPSTSSYEEWVYDHDYEEDCVYLDAFKEFLSWGKNKRKKWYAQQFNSLKTKETPMYVDEYLPCNEAPAYHSCFKTACNKISANTPKKETKMYATSNTAIVATAPSDESKQREYLLDRLYFVQDNQHDDARKFFKIDPVSAPRTIKELIEKIKADDFSVEDKDINRNMSFYYMNDYIRWSKDKADHEGFNVADKKISEQFQKTKDIIMIKSPVDGLAALEAFESATFH